MQQQRAIACRIHIITNTITHIEIYEGQTRQFNQVLKLLKLLGSILFHDDANIKCYFL